MLLSWASQGDQIAAALVRPIDVVIVGPQLLVAARDTGHVFVIDRSSQAIVQRLAVGRQLVDLTVSGDDVLAVDSESHEIVRLSPQGPQAAGSAWQVAARWSIPRDPLVATVSSNGAWLSVSSRWARQLSLFARDDAAPGKWSLRKTIDLAFAPGQQVWLGSASRLVVTDALGGHLIVVDPALGHITHSRQLAAHNIRGLAYDEGRDVVLISHQQLASHLPTTRDRIFWGNLLGNLLLTVTREHLEEEAARGESFRPLGRWAMEPLGQNSAAAGDPAGLAVARDGTRLVCLSGVGQLAICAGPRGSFERLSVGEGATSVAIDEQAKLAYVANRFDDCVSIVDYAARRVVATISLQEDAAEGTAEDARQRGERLFYDARLSLDGWFSCHSCHTDGHTNGLLNDNFADHVEGTPKRIPSLLGTNGTEPWSWLGQQTELSEQIARSLATTMRCEEVGRVTPQTAVDLAAYLMSLPPAPGIDAARGVEQTEPLQNQVARGKELFASLNCRACHAGEKMTSHANYEVGLSDQVGNRRFNPPSLLGVSQRDRWLHDGRATSLKAVFADWGHPAGKTSQLSAEDLEALVAYLRTL